MIKNSRLGQSFAACIVMLGVLMPLQSAHANQLLEECTRQQLSFATEQQGLENKISCLQSRMEHVLQLNNDIKRLNLAIAKIRGTFISGSESDDKCGDFLNPKKVEKDGICAASWNNFAHHRHEYFRFHCKLGYNSNILVEDETVGYHRIQAETWEKEYQACFSANIPLDIQDEYVAHDREALRTSFIRLQDEMQALQPVTATFKSLADACNAALGELEKYDPKTTRSCVPRNRQ